MKIPAHFPKWDAAVDGLEDAGRWMMEIERSLLPPDTMFPCEGQVWEAIRDCEVSFQTSIPLPRKGVLVTAADIESYMKRFATAKLRQGERVRILKVEPKPITVRFNPLRYQELEADIVPEEIRKHPRYRGYTLHLKVAKTISDFCVAGGPHHDFFNEVFHLVEDETSGV